MLGAMAMAGDLMSAVAPGPTYSTAAITYVITPEQAVVGRSVLKGMQHVSYSSQSAPSGAATPDALRPAAGGACERRVAVNVQAPTAEDGPQILQAGCMQQLGAAASLTTLCSITLAHPLSHLACHQRCTHAAAAAAG